MLISFKHKRIQGYCSNNNALKIIARILLARTLSTFSSTLRTINYN